MWKAATAVGAGMVLLLIASVLPGTAAQATTDHKVTLCHATGSTTNPYVTITISENGLNGHEGHAGDITPAPATGCPGTVAGGVDANGNSADHDKITICHATHSQTNPYVRITISTNGLNGHGDHADDIIPATDVTCPAGVSVNLKTQTNVHMDDKLHVNVKAQKEIKSSSVVTIVLSNEDDKESTEVVDVTGQLQVRVMVNGVHVPDSQVRVLFIRPVGSSIDLTTSAPVANVRLDGTDVSGSSSVTFGAAPVALPTGPVPGAGRPSAPAPAAGGAPSVTVPGPASTGNAGLASVNGQMPWAPVLIALALAVVFGGRMLGTNGRRG